MSFFRGSETVVIKRRSANSTDDYGNKTFSLTTITVNNCMIGFDTQNELLEPNREAMDQSLTIYMPNGTQIQPGDRFMIRGTEFILDGNSQNWEPPFNFNVGVVVKVKKRNG
jgi:hypothetical protein